MPENEDKLSLESFGVRLQEQDDGSYELRYFDAGQVAYVRYLDTQHEQALANYDQRVEEARARAQEQAAQPFGGLAWVKQEFERARAMQREINHIMAAGRKPPAEEEQKS